MLLIFVFVLMQYLYAIIIYYGFSEFYIIHYDAKGEVAKMVNDGEYEAGTQHIDICYSLMTCFSTLFDLLFKIDGGHTGMFNDIQRKGRRWFSEKDHSKVDGYYRSTFDLVLVRAQHTTTNVCSVLDL